MTTEKELDAAVANAFGRVAPAQEALAPGQYVNAFGRVVDGSTGIEAEAGVTTYVNAFGRRVVEEAPEVASKTVSRDPVEETSRLVHEMEGLAVSRLGMSREDAAGYAVRAYLFAAGVTTPWREAKVAEPLSESALDQLANRVAGLRGTTPLGAGRPLAESPGSQRVLIDEVVRPGRPHPYQ